MQSQGAREYGVLKRGVIASGVALMLALTSCASPKTPARQADPIDQITLKRRACYGTCPVYEVSVASDGSMRFVGHKYVQLHGVAHATIVPEHWQRLLAAVDDADFASLQRRYAPHYGCVEGMTDQPWFRISISRAGKVKLVEVYEGCQSTPALEAASRLGRVIDAELDTARWIGVGCEVGSPEAWCY
ncbi:DUF6438 domain-containing protein [Stenotrophomonas rhizophila]